MIKTTTMITNYRQHFHCVVMICAVLSGKMLCAAELEKDAITVGTQKQLFVDNRFIASSRGVTLTMNEPRRDGQVLIKCDQPWEQGASIGVYSSVMKDNGKVRLWYDLIRPTGPGPYDHERRVAYAESKNGIEFVKPIQNLHEVDGSKANNIVLPGVIGGCSVWIDENAPLEHRYKTQAKVYPSGQLHMHSSPDGLNWKFFQRLEPGPGGWDTQSIVFWDYGISRYVLFTRRWVRHEPRQTSYRTVRRLESTDFKHWENETVVFQADEIDLASQETQNGQPPVDYYGADVFEYEGVKIMLAEAYWHWQSREPLKGLGPSGFDVRLAASRDGKQFQRIGKRKAFMAMGPSGRFDSRYVWALPHPIQMDDELWIYYVGSNRDHDGNIDPAANGQHLSGIGRAILRLDGFVSADADYKGGQITTPPISFEGNRLELNVDASGGGSVLVEVLDRSGSPLPGFTKQDATAVNKNSVRAQVNWGSRNDVSSLSGKPIRLRFHLKNCKLYAFQFRR